MTIDSRQQPDRQAMGHLLARPAQVVGTALLGLQPLKLNAKRDGFLYMPESYQPDRPAPLVLMLHGAGSNAHNGLAPFLHLANTFGVRLTARN